MEEIDLDTANAARMYDYMLGGAHNVQADRDRVDAVVAANPQAVANAWANRAFLGRVVSWCTVVRDRPGIRALFGDHPLVPPGLVVVTDWPEPTPGPRLAIYGGVATIDATDTDRP